MTIFIERYLLPVTAGLTLLIITTNPMKFDWRQRISGGLALVLASYFFAHTSEIWNRKAAPAPQESTAPGPPAAVPPTRQSGPATTFGDHSPANTGDGNTFSDGTAPKKAGDAK
jgi:hypothetical protein